MTARITGPSFSVGLGLAYVYAALVPQSRLMRAMDFVWLGPSALKRSGAAVTGLGFIALGIYLTLS